MYLNRVYNMYIQVELRDRIVDLPVIYCVRISEIILPVFFKSWFIVIVDIVRLLWNPSINLENYNIYVEVTNTDTFLVQQSHYNKGLQLFGLVLNTPHTPRPKLSYNFYQCTSRIKWNHVI